MNVPDFIEGIHYKELKRGKYRFELLVDIYFKTLYLKEIRYDGKISFRDYSRKEWVRIENDVYIIRAGYQWNGCSPKKLIPILKIWVGTPDFEKTRFASCWHDTSLQFFHVADFPFPLEICNSTFRDILRARNFRWSETWHGAVEDFSEMALGKFPQRGEHSFVIKKPSRKK
jgi:hypothetical protein